MYDFDLNAKPKLKELALANPKRDGKEGGETIGLAGDYLYHLDGDKLFLCQYKPGEKPAEWRDFKHMPESGKPIIVYVLDRIKPPVKDDENIQGKWKLVGGLAGKDQKLSEKLGVTLTFAKDIAKFEGGDILRQQFKFTLDPSAKPKTLDFKWEGPIIGGPPTPIYEPSEQNIYYLSGDFLHICSFKQKPTKWSKVDEFPEDGEPLVLYIFKRVEVPKPNEPKPAAKPDKELLQGTWQAVSMRYQGQDFDGADVGITRWAVEDDTIRMYVADTFSRRQFRVEPAKDPKEIDISFPDVHPEGKPAMRTWPGIYELNGDRMKVCWNMAGGDNPVRPLEFVSTRSDHFYVITFERKPDAKAAMEAWNKLKGTWELETEEFQGGIIDSKIPKPEKRWKFAEGKITVEHGDWSWTGDVRIDLKARSMAVKQTNAKPGDSFTIDMPLAIYEISGDTLRVCANNDHRTGTLPTDFSTAATNHNHLRVFKRLAEPKTPYRSAMIELHRDAKGDAFKVPLKRELRGPEELAALAVYFPEMGQGKQGDKPAGWEAAATISFVVNTEGEEKKIRVAVAWDYSLWSEGNGDWKLKKGLDNRLKAIFADGDRKALQGVWKVTAVEEDGKTRPAEDLDDMKWTIDGDRIVRCENGKEVEWTLKRLDPMVLPKSMLFWLNDKRVLISEVIYELDGDNLRACVNVGAPAAPTEFKAAEGSKHILYTFKREKPPNGAEGDK